MEGHELSNPFCLSFNPPYYQGLLEQAGYSKLLDLFSYSWASNQPVPERLERISSRLDIGSTATKRYRIYRKKL